MKKTKQRVIALDYFRGICILLVLINHSFVFSVPFAYFAGAGGLWTSAAEMFFLLSGITFAIVRGSQIKDNFRLVLKKTMRRAVLIYLVYIMTVALSIVLSLYLTSHDFFNNIPGQLSTTLSPLALFASVLSFKYTAGWCDFLMYYTIFLATAPVVYYALLSRLAALVPIFSAGLFMIYSLGVLPQGAYSSFALWQIYFVLGLTLIRFRPAISSVVSALPARLQHLAASGLVWGVCALMTLSYLLEHSVYPTVGRLASEGWLPVKLQAAYIHLLSYRPALDQLMLNDRAGVLRPLVAVLVAAAAFIVYKRHESYLMATTGKFLNGFGRDTLWIFIAHAFAVPVLAALPLPRTLFINTLLITSLILSMWALTQRRAVYKATQIYWQDLKLSYNISKNNYLQSFDEN
ncbi:OpgC domain-containing protein [Candidatus Saccharibacteria bacterium]|nr:OpgC domain-containing protein [Candidatus Saccharibacteria bacterium]